MKINKTIFSIILLTTITIIFSCKKDDGFIPTCNDGIQNGSETGIDCGGSCAPCFSCNDNIQNGNETGVDCGGDLCPPCPTCDDGIMNGNETGIDCGGDCSSCLSDVIPGIWKVQKSIRNGVDILASNNIEIQYIDFKTNGDLKTFNRTNMGNNSTSSSTYQIVADKDSIKFVGANSSIYSVKLLDQDTRIRLEYSTNNTNHKIVATRINNDLCKNIDCNDGICAYGFCECPSGYEGEFCEITYGPGGGIVAHDKGSYSDGWRYIEVYPRIFDPMRITCSGVTFNGSYYASIGGGKPNTLNAAFACNFINSFNAAQFAIDFEANGFNDWYVPNLAEMFAIVDEIRYFFDFTVGTNVQTSSLIEYPDISVFRFNTSGDDEFLILSGKELRPFFLIRYY